MLRSVELGRVVEAFVGVSAAADPRTGSLLARSGSARIERGSSARSARPVASSGRRLPSVSSVALAGAVLCVWCFVSCGGTNAGASWKNYGAFAALMEDGNMRTWGAISDGGGVTVTAKPEAIRSIYSTRDAFAVLGEGGKLVSWSDLRNGFTHPANLTNVRDISCTLHAFAALTDTGNVVAWGDHSSGGSAPPGLEGVRAIYATYKAFAALKEDGTVQAWGDPEHGGSMSDTNLYRGVPEDLAGVRTIYASARAFAALKEDGTVQAWGNRELGGEGVPAGQGNVAAIFSTAGAFAALREDGSVVAWGSSAFGGTGVPAGLSHVTTIYSTAISFLAHREDGRLVAWGAVDGGTVPADLDVVTSISATTYAFAAVTEQGTVVAWGNSRFGGSMTDVTIDGVLYTGVPAGLRGVLAIYSNQQAFAALRDDGTVHAWGDSRYGGVGVPATLRNVKSIFSTLDSFAALTNEGTVAAWGSAYAGGSMSNGNYNGNDYAGVPRDLAGVKTIFGATMYYADSTARDLYPCPHNTYGRGFPNCTACPALDKPASQPFGRPGIRSDAGSCMDCGQSPGIRDKQIQPKNYPFGQRRYQTRIASIREK